MAWAEMLAASLMTLLVGVGLGAAALRLWRTERALTEQALTLRRNGLLLLETQRLHLRQTRLEDAQKIAEVAVETGTDVVRTVHRSIAAIPFGILEAVPATRDAARVVRQTHDLIADAVYGSIKGINKGVGSLTRGALKTPRNKTDEPR